MHPTPALLPPRRRTKTSPPRRWSPSAACTRGGGAGYGGHLALPLHRHGEGIGESEWVRRSGDGEEREERAMLAQSHRQSDRRVVDHMDHHLSDGPVQRRAKAQKRERSRFRFYVFFFCCMYSLLSLMHVGINKWDKILYMICTWFMMNWIFYQPMCFSCNVCVVHTFHWANFNYSLFFFSWFTSWICNIFIFI
jgi:hypothetical protein